MDPGHLKIRAKSGAISDGGPKSGSGAGSRAGFITAPQRAVGKRFRE